MLEAINLDEHTIPTGSSLHPTPLIHCPIPLQHPALPMAHTRLELALVLDAGRPDFLTLPMQHAILYPTSVVGLGYDVVGQSYRPTLHLLFFNDWYGPFAGPLLLSLREIPLIHASFETDKFAIALRLPILEIPDETASILVNLDACPMLKPILELALEYVA